ncbi:hypothetical protein ACE1TI_21415 [Alteribacillus sp. JSM 102045]
MKEKCTKSKGNRQVRYNPVYEELKAKAKEEPFGLTRAHKSMLNVKLK